jgi:CRP-like cAMP-binding protein
VLRSGEHFGEIALQRAATRTTSARVRTPATLLVLEREQLLKSMAHVLSLPDDQRQLVIWLTRRREASLAEVASHLGLDQATTRAKLEPLVDQGYLQTIERAAEPHYRPSFGTRRVSRLRPEMWRALDGL